MEHLRSILDKLSRAKKTSRLPTTTMPLTGQTTIPATISASSKGKQVARGPLPDLSFSTVEFIKRQFNALASESIPMSTLVANDLTTLGSGPMIKAEGGEDGADERVEKGARNEEGRGVDRGVQQGEGSCTPRELEECTQVRPASGQYDFNTPIDRSPWEMGAVEYHDALQAQRRIGAEAGRNALVWTYAAWAATSKEGWDILLKARIIAERILPAMIHYFMEARAQGWDWLAWVKNLGGVIVFLLALPFMLVYAAGRWGKRRVWPYRRIIVLALVLLLVLCLVLRVNIVLLLVAFLKAFPGWIKAKLDA